VRTWRTRAPEHPAPVYLDYLDYIVRVMRLDLLTALFVFMLAAFLGLDIIRRVSRLLHTPLMSLTNAISSIAVVGAIIIAGEAHDPLSTALGALAVFASTTNLVSGYLITDRMLRMFKRRDAPKS
jgi:H+-translocating NAD(P) transhydrogenase subunit alpha